MEIRIAELIDCLSAFLRFAPEVRLARLCLAELRLAEVHPADWAPR